MDNATLIPTFAAFLVAGAYTLGITPLVRLAARRRGYIAKPTNDRWHKTPTALMGGIAIYAGFALAMLTMLLVTESARQVLNVRTLGIFGAATVMFGTGVADDIFKFGPATKLILQIVAAATMVAAGVVYGLTPWVVLNVLLTMFWFLAITNALNLLDNMDGVAAGVSGVAALFLGFTFYSRGQAGLAIGCFALSGSTVGFLRFNFYPATIFMGDSGSLFIGSMLAGLAAAFPGTAPGSVVSVMFAPALIVIIPIIDTTLVTITRTLAGRSIAQGGRDHTTHRLIAFGLSERQVALTLYGVSAIGGLVALFVQQAAVGFSLLTGALFLVILVVLAAYLSKLHSYTPEELDRTTGITLLVSDLLYKRRALEVVLDLILISVAYFGAFLLRFEGSLPAAQIDVFQKTLWLAIAVKAATFGLSGIYKGDWEFLGLADLYRVVRAIAFSSLALIGATVFLHRTSDFSRTVFVIDALLLSTFMLATRLSIRSFETWRASVNRSGTRTLIYGAGKGGELVLRELRSNRDLNMLPVGFLDDEARKRGRMFHSLPVIGGCHDVRAAVLQTSAVRVVIATEKVDPIRREALVAACESMRVEVVSLNISFPLVTNDPSNIHSTEGQRA